MAETSNGSAETAAVPPPKKKRSLFTKSASAKLANDEEDAVDFFSRAKDKYPQQLLEEQRKREKKAEKLERKRSTMSAEAKSCSPSGEKRRRISSSKHSDEDQFSEDSNLDEDGSRKQKEFSISTPIGHRSGPSSTREKSHAPPISLSERYNQDLHARKQAVPKVVELAKGYISLSDSDSDSEPEVIQVGKPVPRAANLDRPQSRSAPRRHPPTDDLEILEDEEFPELMEAARKRQRALEEAKALAGKAQKPNGNTLDLDDDIFETGSPVKRDMDPVIEILITSQMEGTRPLMVKRKLSGRIKEVRWSWCDTNSSLGPSLRDRIFLTWKGIKTYDATTCRGLGLKVDDRGRLLSGDGIDSDGRVHLEAWTEEEFKAHQRQVEAKERRMLNSGMDEDAGEEEPEEPVPKMKLIMKTKDLEFKLLVKPETTIEKLIMAFRKGKNIPDEHGISLRFDGDPLDPGDTVADTELEDMDEVEVRIA